MADYYPLISRAVAGLEHNTGENRRVLYERARSALVAQLRGVQPPLDEADITRERLALEEAIRKVEVEAAKRPLPEPPPSPPAESAAPAPSPSLRDRGLRDFRDSVSEVEDLGGAASEANRAARKVFKAMPGDHPPPDESEPEALATTTHYFEPPAEAGEPAPLPEPAEHEAAEHEPAEHAPTEHETAALASEERFNEVPFEDRAEPAATMPPPPMYDEHEHEEAEHRQVRSYGRLVKILLLILVLVGIAGAAYWQRGAITTMVASLRSATTAPPAVKPAPAPTTTAKPKIADRVAPSTAPGVPAKPATAPTAAVAQKVVLYEEEPNNPQGKRYVGSAIWRTETVSPGPGLAPELAVRADVEIPERHLRMTWSLLKERDWFDIPVVYTSGKRAILAMEKGTPGQRAFEEAFRAWGE
jgi:hypothetical protein